MNIVTAYYESLIGALEITGTERGILTVGFAENTPDELCALPKCLTECVSQLDEYFKGSCTEFSLSLIPEGTPFQQEVWQQLLKIPFGETRTYHDIAAAVGKPRGAQAVGRANALNPIAIIIPCHRIIASDGKLTGYAGGLWRKEWLLRHEGALMF
jgi:methylated-DNA-[protein]-cysteine S-methyltransferase